MNKFNNIQNMFHTKPKYGITINMKPKMTHTWSRIRTQIQFPTTLHVDIQEKETALPDALVGQQLMEIQHGVHHPRQTQPCTFQSHCQLRVQQLPRHTWLVLKDTVTVQTQPSYNSRFLTHTEQLHNVTETK
jgi:hypothetical protein